MDKKDFYGLPCYFCGKDSERDNDDGTTLISTVFYKYMQEKGSSDNHQVNNLKVVIDFANFIGLFR